MNYKKIAMSTAAQTLVYSQSLPSIKIKPIGMSTELATIPSWAVGLIVGYAASVAGDLTVMNVIGKQHLADELTDWQDMLASSAGAGVASGIILPLLQQDIYNIPGLLDPKKAVLIGVLSEFAALNVAAMI